MHIYEVSRDSSASRQTQSDDNKCSTTHLGKQQALSRSHSTADGSVMYSSNPSTLPHSLQWLTDNGSIYTSNKTRKYAADAGFEICTPPAYSPSSNGMAVSSVKTFKRDYVQVHTLETPEEVMMQLGKWFEDYNSNHLHKSKDAVPRESRQPSV